MLKETPAPSQLLTGYIRFQQDGAYCILLTGVKAEEWFFDQKIVDLFLAPTSPDIKPIE